MQQDNFVLKNIRWSFSADLAYLEILHNLLENGFLKFAEKLDTLTMECLATICKFPKLYPHIEEFNVHRVVFVMILFLRIEFPKTVLKLLILYQQDLITHINYSTCFISYFIL